MTMHLEWADAKEASQTVVVVPPFTDLGGDPDVGKDPAFVLDTGSSLMVIEGTEEELSLLLKRMAAALNRYQNWDVHESERHEQSDEYGARTERI